MNAVTIKNYHSGLKIFTLIFLVALTVFSSCDYRPQHPSLWKFGNHKKRFQKVLDYYSKPEDSLKLRAAEFLIENMVEHYYYQPKNQDNWNKFVQYLESVSNIPALENNELREELREELINNYAVKAVSTGRFHWPDYRKKSDLKTIPPEYLIENIEYAFKAWDFPWARSISFEDFCRYILPYRYGNEPLDKWRKNIFEQYKWVADSLNEVTNPMEVAYFVNEQFVHKISQPDKLVGFRFKISDHLNLMAHKSCTDQSGLGVCVLRALGVPATQIGIPFFRGYRFGHSVTAVLDNDKNWHYINFSDPTTENDLNYESPKMYLKRFDNMNRYSPVQEDVTHDLMNVIDIEIDVNTNDPDEIYLCIFRNLVWSTLCAGEKLNSGVVFKNIGNKSNMFMAATKQGKKLNALSYPFSADSTGTVSYYKPDNNNLLSATLHRKYPKHGRDSARINALIGGRFTVSDSLDQIVKKRVHKIDTSLNYYNNIIKCSEQKGKYLFFEFPQIANAHYDGPAEVLFYTTQQDTLKKLDGKYLVSSQISDEHIQIMTDDDILTYVEVWHCQKTLNKETGKFILTKKDEPLWIGMELDTATLVTHVGICPRNDKNGIYPGMRYELFYWDDKWISLGIKVATNDSIRFEGIPGNAVLWLRNLDEGKEERIFTLEDGKQVWW